MLIKDQKLKEIFLNCYKGDISDQQIHDSFVEKLHTNYNKLDIFHVQFSGVHLILDKITNKDIVIIFEDQPEFFDHVINELQKLFKHNTNKNFYFIVDIDGWKQLADWPANVFFMNYSPIASMDGISNYKNIPNLVNKNFESCKIGISLNRLPRPHRLCFISYMLGKGYDEHCLITAPLLKWQLENNNTNLKDVLSWEGIDISNDFGISTLKGWERAKQGDGVYVDTDAYPPYNELTPSSKVFANSENYQNQLVHLYTNSFVEFVMETVFDINLHIVTEKYLHSQLGCNFPIILAGYRSVEYMRSLDLDMFDDIVNHNYDKEINPRLRMERAVQDNAKLFLNTENTKKLWQKNYKRFEYNVQKYIEMNFTASNTALQRFDSIFQQNYKNPLLF